ncbi:MAG: nickel-dependent lactate racemase [Lentisphaerae bacterium]|nr:nickel-dependent lactate racemase [Lentisphaerota bacterium]
MKSVEIEFGISSFAIRVPDRTDVLTLPDVEVPADPAAEIERGLLEPSGCPALSEVIRQKTSNPTAAIVVSDNTRPVPYKGPGGILEPIVDVLREGGVSDIVVLVATGTHRGLSDSELEELLPPAIRDPDVRVVNHDCTARESLRCIGRTSRGTDAWVNTLYLDADIKILTGLVEPHFMAGFSGGRKSICPGLVGLDATHVFHGPAMMADPRADSLVMEGNPCHEESLEVARMAGCDFLVNVTIDRHKRLTGVFCGEMETAHAAACARESEANAIPIAHEYDLVVTHAGFAGINHYQAAKAACEAAKAVRPGGTIVLAANHTDVDPVGSANYRSLLPLLADLGPDRLNERLRGPDWTFVPDQWEAQKWGEIFARLGAMDNLVYCAPRLTGPAFSDSRVPGADGGLGLDETDECRLAALMVQRAVDGCLEVNPEASVAVLADGPYGVPVKQGRE